MNADSNMVLKPGFDTCTHVSVTLWCSMGHGLWPRVAMASPWWSPSDLQASTFKLRWNKIATL